MSILEELGVASLASAAPLERTHESLPAWATEFVRQLNEQNVPEPARLAWLTRVQRFNSGTERADASPITALDAADVATIALARRSEAFAAGAWRDALDAFEATLAQPGVAV